MPKKLRILATNHKGNNAIWLKHVDLLPGWVEEVMRRRVNCSENSLWFNLKWALKLFWVSRDYDVVVTGSDRSAMLFAIFQKIFRRKRKKHILLHIVWNLPESRFRKFLKKCEYRILLKSVSKVIVYGERQQKLHAQVFGQSIEKFPIVPYHTTIGDVSYVVAEGDYIFSGGDGTRDYMSLMKAVDGLPYKVIIAVRYKSSVETRYVPSNVSIVSVSHEEFVSLMAGSRAVVVPFRSGLLQAGGQQTFLNTMSMGKTIIVADDNSADEYIENGVDGIIVCPGDVSALRASIISVMKNDEYRRKLEANARRKALEYTEDRFVLGVLNVIEELYVE